jgi:predicted nuclease of restriction endonuclease-like (RecB) superfamily
MNNAEYLKVVAEIKSRIHEAKHRAILTANSGLIMLNWHIGKTINEHSSWGSKFIDNLARDIKLEFPAAKGFSVRNLKYMTKFAKTYPDF